MKIFCKTRDEARKLKGNSSKPFRLKKADKPFPNGHKWALVLDNSKAQEKSKEFA